MVDLIANTPANLRNFTITQGRTGLIFRPGHSLIKPAENVDQWTDRLKKAANFRYMFSLMPVPSYIHCKALNVQN